MQNKEEQNDKIQAYSCAYLRVSQGGQIFSACVFYTRDLYEFFVKLEATGTAKIKKTQGENRMQRYLSTSPKTMSWVPIIVTTSANM